MLVDSIPSSIPKTLLIIRYFDKYSILEYGTLWSDPE